jgi:hypothetical protein
MVTYWQTDKQKRGCLHEVSLKNQHQHSRMTTMTAKNSGSNLNDGEGKMASRYFSGIFAEMREESFGDKEAAEYEMVQHWPLETAVW